MKKIKATLPIVGDCEIEPQCDQCIYNMMVISKPGGIKVKCKKCGRDYDPETVKKIEQGFKKLYGGDQ